IRLTNERFIEDPFLSDDKKIYKTGDLAKVLSDGSLCYLGRNDAQIKLKGYRIELQGIESALEKHPTIDKAVVQMTGSEYSDKHLVVFIKPIDSDFLSYLKIKRFRELGLFKHTSQLPNGLIVSDYHYTETKFVY